MTWPLIALSASSPFRLRFWEKFPKATSVRCGLSHLIPSYQFGFRPSHSPIQQAHRVVNEIVTSLEERALCTAVFDHVAHAFDKVWYIGLLYKLKTSLPGPYYLLLQSYLTNRYFQV